MKFSFTVQHGPRSHRVECEREFIPEDLDYLLDSLFSLSGRKYLLLDSSGTLIDVTELLAHPFVYNNQTFSLYFPESEIKKVGAQNNAFLPFSELKNKIEGLEASKYAVLVFIDSNESDSSTIIQVLSLQREFGNKFEVLFFSVESEEMELLKTEFFLDPPFAALYEGPQKLLELDFRSPWETIQQVLLQHVNNDDKEEKLLTIEEIQGLLERMFIERGINDEEFYFLKCELYERDLGSFLYGIDFDTGIHQYLNQFFHKKISAGDHYKVLRRCYKLCLLSEDSYNIGLRVLGGGSSVYRQPLENALEKLERNEVSAFECSHVIKELIELAAIEGLKTEALETSGYKSPQFSSPNKSYFLKSGKSPSVRKSMPQRPEISIDNFLNEHQEEFEIEEMAICRLAEKEGDTDFISKLNELIQNQDAIIIIKSMLELKFNKRLQDSFEKNDVNQIVKNLNSPDFKSLIQNFDKNLDFDLLCHGFRDLLCKTSVKPHNSFSFETFEPKFRLEASIPISNAANGSELARRKSEARMKAKVEEIKQNVEEISENVEENREITEEKEEIARGFKESVSEFEENKENYERNKEIEENNKKIVGNPEKTIENQKNPENKEIPVIESRERPNTMNFKDPFTTKFSDFGSSPTTNSFDEQSPFLNAYKNFYQDKLEKFLENAAFLEYEEMFKKIAIKAGMLLNNEEAEYLEKLYEELDVGLLQVIEKFKDTQNSDQLKVDLRNLVENMDFEKLHDCYSPYSMQKIKIYHHLDYKLTKIMSKSKITKEIKDVLTLLFFSFDFCLYAIFELYELTLNPQEFLENLFLFLKRRKRKGLVKKANLFKKKEVYEQMKTIFAFSADLEDSEVLLLQKKTFEEDFNLLSLHNQFKAHKNKSQFIEDVQNYLQSINDEPNKEEPVPVVERKVSNQEEKKSEDIEISPLQIEGPRDKMKKSAIKEAAKFGNISKNNESNKEEETNLNTEENKEKNANLSEEEEIKGESADIAKKNDKMSFLSKFFLENQIDFGEVSVAFLKMMLEHKNQMLTGAFDSFFALNEKEEFFENLHLFFQAEFHKTFERTIHSLIDPLHLDPYKLEILRKHIQNREDSLVGGFEVYALNSNSEEEKKEFLDTINKVLNIERRIF